MVGLNQELDTEWRYCQQCGRVAVTKMEEHDKPHECPHCKDPMAFHEPEEGRRR
jgi:hypothetical protein